MTLWLGMQSGLKMSVFNAKHFTDETAAYAFVEARVWPAGRVCPHCGVVDKSGALKGKSTRPGVYKCYACRKPFTVKVGTIFESSHIPMHVWLQAMFLLRSSKKGMSANQLHRTLGVTLKSAWFMAHRIREAMKGGFLGPLGGEGKIVEADETYIGQREGTTWQDRRGNRNKIAVLALVERGGKARSFRVGVATKQNIQGRVHANVDRKTHLMTDEASHYARDLGMRHSTVNHGEKEYARGNVTTNTVEGFFSIFKRGMKGIYQHCEDKHLSRYLNEFDFRYSNRIASGVDDETRALRAIDGVIGKRLLYRELTQ